ncbi:hypothetical protein [Schlesneria sp.]|uniref:hypothetical protein n=1 Tax=Schlesneria sp. TaxID=2762018 RepID=UPI002F2177BE
MVIEERISAAKALGVSDRQLGRWKLTEGFPDCSNGYDIDAIQAWREANQRKGSAEDDQIAVINRAIKLEKLKEIKAKNHLAGLAIDEAEKRLLPRQLYEQFIAALLAGIGDWCNQLPGLLEAEIPAKYGKKVKARAAEECRKMRERLAEDLKRTPTG